MLVAAAAELVGAQIGDETLTAKCCWLGWEETTVDGPLLATMVGVSALAQLLLLLRGNGTELAVFSVFDC